MREGCGKGVGRVWEGCWKGCWKGVGVLEGCGKCVGSTITINLSNLIIYSKCVLEGS